MALASLSATLDRTGGDVAQFRELVQPLRAAPAESGRYGIGFRHDAHGRLFVSPWQGAEPFFRDGAGAAMLPKDGPKASDIDEFLNHAGDVPMAYGYPLFADTNGLLTPLLYCAVTLQETGGKRRLVKLPGARPRLHQAPLLAVGFDRASVHAAAEAVEHGSYRSLADCLGHVFALLGWTDPPFNDADLAELADAPQAGWINSAALFLRPTGPAHRKLLEEIDRLDGLYGETINPTALHALAAPDSVAAGVATTALAEIAPTTPDLPPILDHCLRAPLSAIQAAPGTAKPALILDLIASLVIDGRSVLLIAPTAHALDHYAGRLQALLDPSQHWIPRPGAPEMLDKLLHSVEQLSHYPPRSTDRAETQAMQQRLADQRRGIAALHRQVEAVRKGHRHLATRQRWRRNQRAEVSEAWLPVYEQKPRIEIDPTEAEAWREEARQPAVRRGRSRRGGSGISAETLAAKLEEMLSPLPALLRDELMEPVREAPDDDALMTRLVDAFDELARYAAWRRASVHESQAADMLTGAPTGESLLQQFALGQADGARTARGLLRQTWQAAIAANPAKAAERLANSFDAMERRAMAGGSQHAVGERQLGKVIGVLSLQYPLWMVTADEAAHRLPLVDGLFDMAIIDDADHLPAPALLPLLVRARRAVVIGATAQTATNTPGDGLSLCWARDGVARHRLEAQARSHPQIVDYLAEAFHGGRLTAFADHAGMREIVPSALPGLHWHEAPVGKETGAALDLVAGWMKTPLPDLERPFTVGVVAADPALLAALNAAMGARGLDAVRDERLLVGPPDRFYVAVVDLLLLLPGIHGATTAPRAAYLAANRALFHDAAAAARCGLHVVGEAEACLKAGGHAGQLARACRRLAELGARAAGELSEELRSRLVAVLNDTGLAWWPDRGGYRVVGRLGQPYQVELPGGTAEADWVAPDDPDLIPVIVDPFDLRRNGDRLKARLDRLV